MPQSLNYKRELRFLKLEVTSVKYEWTQNQKYEKLKNARKPTTKNEYVRFFYFTKECLLYLGACLRGFTTIPNKKTLTKSDGIFDDFW